MTDAQQLAQRILDTVGGSSNIADVENCMTRLRVEVASLSSVDLPAPQACGLRLLLVVRLRTSSPLAALRSRLRREPAPTAAPCAPSAASPRASSRPSPH